MPRTAQEIVFNWADGQTVSTNSADAGFGVIGTVIVPSGSDLIGKTLQFVAHSPEGLYADTDLLSSPPTIVAGANRLTTDELAELGGVQGVKLKVNSAVSGTPSCVLLWKA